MYQYFVRIDTLELMVDRDAIRRRFESLLPTVDERMRRLIAAAESLAIDYGGISIVSRATGVSRRAIARGIVEPGNPQCLSAELSVNLVEDARAQWNRTRRW